MLTQSLGKEMYVKYLFYLHYLILIVKFFLHLFRKEMDCVGVTCKDEMAVKDDTVNYSYNFTQPVKVSYTDFRCT